MRRPLSSKCRQIGRKSVGFCEILFRDCDFAPNYAPCCALPSADSLRGSAKKNRATRPGSIRIQEEPLHDVFECQTLFAQEGGKTDPRNGAKRARRKAKTYFASELRVVDSLVLHVWLLGPSGLVMSVRYGISRKGLLAANYAFSCHGFLQIIVDGDVPREFRTCSFPGTERASEAWDRTS